MAASSLTGFGGGNGRTVIASDRAYGASKPPDHEVVCDEEGDDEAGSWNYAGATLSLARSGGADPNDRFGATGTLAALTEGSALAVGGVRVGTVTRNSGGRLFLTFCGADAREDYVDAVLRQVTYANAARHPNAPVDLHWTFRDGHAGRLIAEGRTTVTVDGAPIWRAPRRAA